MENQLCVFGVAAHLKLPSGHYVLTKPQAKKSVKTDFQTRVVKPYISKIFPLWLLTFIVSEFRAVLCHIGKFGFANSELMLQLSWCSQMKLEIMTNTSVARSGSFGNLPNSKCGHDGSLICTWIVRGKKSTRVLSVIHYRGLTPTHRSRNSLWRYLHDMFSLGCFLYIDMFPSSLTPSSCQFL